MADEAGWEKTWQAKACSLRHWKEWTPCHLKSRGRPSNCGVHDVVQKNESGKGIEGRTRCRRPSAQGLLPVARGPFKASGRFLDEAARRMDEKAACAEERVNAAWQRNLTSRVAEGNAASLATVNL